MSFLEDEFNVAIKCFFFFFEDLNEHKIIYVSVFSKTYDVFIEWMMITK